jgi:hypothetical protein
VEDKQKVINLGRLKKLTTALPMQVFDAIQLAAEDIASFNPKSSHHDVLTHWLEQEDYDLACHYLAYALPLVESLHWGLTVARLIHRSVGDEDRFISLFGIIEAWIKNRVIQQQQDNVLFYSSIESLQIPLGLETEMPIYWLVQAILKVKDYDEAKAEAQPLWQQFISNAVGTLMSTAVLYFPVNALVLDKVRRECYIDFIHRGAHIAGGGNGDLGPLQLSGQ